MFRKRLLYIPRNWYWGKEDANYDNKSEKRKEDSINQYLYYVTNDFFTDWFELPDIKQSQLKGSRLIIYIFICEACQYKTALLYFVLKYIEFFLI